MLFGTCTIYGIITKNAFEFLRFCMTDKFNKNNINLDVQVFKIGTTYPNNSNNIP
jgi:hypothetical protein